MPSDWSDPSIRDGKQAEFLVHESFPWALVDRIGVVEGTVAEQANKILCGADHRPIVSVQRAWYY